MQYNKQEVSEMSQEETKVKSLNKAITLLDILSSEDGGMKLSQLSQRSGYPKSTVHALLSTMRDRGLVSQTDSGTYTLGIKLFEYGAAVSRGFDISALAKPYLERLSATTASTAVISMMDNRGVVSFDYAFPAGGVRIMPEIGVRLPLHATSQGKLMLAYLPKRTSDFLLKTAVLIPYTPHTVTDTDSLRHGLAAVRENGYAVEDGEYKIGLRSVSAPVFDNEGAVRYALTTVGFFRRAVSEDFLSAVRDTVAQARKLSAALGYVEKS